MRLTESQRHGITTLIRETCGEDATIKLFGSRVDDERRGGDIDLYVETTRDIPYKKRLQLEWHLSGVTDIKTDLIIKMPNSEPMEIYEIAQRGITL